MELDIRMLVAIMVAASSSWLAILICRKFLEACNKAAGGKLFEKKWAKVTGIFLDTLLPFLPCIPSGFLSMAIMSYWPPEGIWDNSLLHFLIGALAGAVASQIYYAITRGIAKQAKRLAGNKAHSDPPPSDVG